MASTYVNDLRLEEIGTGEKSGSWGTVTNTNLELIAEAFSYGSEAIADASTHTITVADGSTDEARSLYLKCTGGGQACTVTLAPNTLSKVWIIENATSYTLTFSQGSSGANVAVSAGQVKMIATDGGGASAGIVYDLLADLSVSGDLFVANTLNVAGDTASGDTAAVGYASADGIIVTGQGSTSDVTLKNDADGTVLTIPTGTTNVDIVGDVTASTINADGDTSASDNAAMGYTSAEGLILTGQGSTNDVTIKNDADADVLVIPTGTTNVDIVGVATAATFEPDGDTSSGDNAAIGYTSAEGLILTGQGSTSDVTFKNDADATVFSIPTGTDDILFPDNAKAMFGDGSDLTAHWDGTDAHITVAGTLNIDGSGETMATFVDDGAVTLYHNGTAKLATSSTGVDVSDSSNTQFTVTSTGGIGSIEVGSATSNQAFIDLKTPSSDDFDVRLASNAGGAGGSLAIAGGTFTLSGSGETMATFVDDGAVTLYHDNSVKLATTSSGVTVTGTVTETSDFRLKSNIETIDSALDKINQMRGVYFDKEGVRSLGVIAQEMQSIIPEAVVEDQTEDKYLSVAYSSLTGVLIEAIKELSDKVKELEAK
jgi:hypothetical protein